MTRPAVEVSHLSHHYGDRAALDDVSFSVAPAEIFGFLGPNGSGKTTLFRILSTLVAPGQGTVSFSGNDAVAHQHAVRQQIGVVFQSPSIDQTLTARENLRCYGKLYGLVGPELEHRIEHALEQLDVSSRADERTGTLSGGMQRRVELAKALLTRPRVLIFDEPSTGLDPGARVDLWLHMQRLRSQDGVTILLTTHLIDEADRCDRVAILDSGRLVACDSPAALKAKIGGDVVVLSSSEPEQLQRALRERRQIESTIVGGAVRFEHASAHTIIPSVIEESPGLVQSVSFGRPTLEDVFLRLTGRSLFDSAVGNPIGNG